MVIPVFYVMARRRKGAVGRRTAKTKTSRNSKKSGSTPEEKPNGALICNSTEVKEIKLSMCTGDTRTASEQPNAIAVQPIPIAHKKFGKFRCLLEVRETEAATSNTFIAPNTTKEEEIVEHISDGIQEVVIGQSDVDISESEQVVWEEEVVEELVVCDDVEIEEEEDCVERIPAETIVLEVGDGKESDSDQIVELRDDGYCNQIENIIVSTESEYSDDYRQTINNSNIPQINRIAFTCDRNIVKYPVLSTNFDVKSMQCESSDRRLGVNCVDGYNQNCHERKICNSAISDQVTYDIQNNVVNMMKGVAIDQEAFIVQVPDNDEQIISESDQEKFGTQKIDYDCNGEHLTKTTEITFKQCPSVTYFNDDNYVGRSLDCVDSNISSRNFIPSGLDSNTLNVKHRTANSTFNEIQGKLSLNDVNCKDLEEDCHSNRFVDFKICEEDSSDRKQQPVFRSRSGSTDTTGSESSSSCSTGVRRSNRIRSIGLMRQRVRGKNDSSDNSIITSSCIISSVDKDPMEMKLPNSETPQILSLYSDVQSEKNDIVTPLTSITNLPIITTSSAQSYENDCNKPVKVKSRWRRSSELEMGGNRSSDSELAATPPTPCISPRPLGTCLTNTSPRLLSPRPPLSSFTVSNEGDGPVDTVQKRDLRIDRKERDDKEMEERLRSYVTITENEYHTDRSMSKEAKRMVCDCFLTKEELARGDMGCGEDCLNRLLMIECGSRCAVGDHCSNKHFQKREYARCDVFKTEKKGFGLKTLDDLPVGAFIMEYVGEVLDPKEFRRRAKEYAKDKNQHYYFMALKSDAIIDATVKGNSSRFINHSCEPNAETQKWTVNGELRIGFFSKRVISAGEEITFDYQFQRYGSSIGQNSKGNECIKVLMNRRPILITCWCTAIWKFDICMFFFWPFPDQTFLSPQILLDRSV